MRDKLLRALGPTGRTHGAANARSKIIMYYAQPPPVWGA